MLVCLLSWLPSYRVASGWLCPLTKGHCSALTTTPLDFLLGSDNLSPPSAVTSSGRKLFQCLCACHTLINRLILLGRVLFIISSKSSIAFYVWSKTKMLSIHSHEAILLGFRFKNTISAHTFKSVFSKLIVMYCMSKVKRSLWFGWLYIIQMSFLEKTLFPFELLLFF